MNRRSLLAALPASLLAAPFGGVDAEVLLHKYPLGGMASVLRSQISGWLANGWRLEAPQYTTEYIDDPDGKPDPLLVGREVEWPGGEVFRWQSERHPSSGGFRGWVSSFDETA